MTASPCVVLGWPATRSLGVQRSTVHMNVLVCVWSQVQALIDEFEEGREHVIRKHEFPDFVYSLAVSNLVSAGQGWMPLGTMRHV